ncbi:hypothetical protein A6V36_10500 [Paraburkholderia ginsengiterrae]|uniref:Lipoprotein n=1 Tax=Paraburkholderia ginsengiterrae TaxID=1462993 RepID=A0A1A9NGU1_9BURK|nr:hypothetical protein [Paraburkholderia ginsengiterrae]OAJ53880.1 hypothetical protein A6V36_10500 [Paraburkholderia ginsengiterrae]OAJ65753.1 hypothetical protein A6V37_12340 [Paraburkholderia ginsengiterrae]
MFRIQALAASAFAALLLSACAPAIPVQSAQIVPLTAAGPHERVRVVTPVAVQLATGYSRQVKAGSVWRPAGEVPQGLVLQPVDTVFTIEGRQVHEAYLVVKENRLVGFFLPGESHFSVLEPSQPITVEKIND